MGLSVMFISMLRTGKVSLKNMVRFIVSFIIILLITLQPYRLLSRGSSALLKGLSWGRSLNSIWTNPAPRKWYFNKMYFTQTYFLTFLEYDFTFPAFSIPTLLKKVFSFSTSMLFSFSAKFFMHFFRNWLVSGFKLWLTFPDITECKVL